MKKLFIALLALFPSEAISGWVEYGATSNSRFYYDPLSVTSRGDLLIVWQKFHLASQIIRREAVLDSRFSDYSHTLSEHAINCSAKKMAVVSHHSYARDGDLLRSSSRREKALTFLDIAPGSIARVMMDRVCEEAGGRIMEKLSSSPGIADASGNSAIRPDYRRACAAGAGGPGSFAA